MADASPIPVLLYNFPGQTGVNFSADTVAALAAHPNIAGMKETGTDAAQLAAFVDATSSSAFSVLVGAAPGFYPGAVRRSGRRHRCGRVRAAGTVCQAALTRARRTSRRGACAAARADPARAAGDDDVRCARAEGGDGCSQDSAAASRERRSRVYPPNVMEEIRAEIGRVLEVA